MRNYAGRRAARWATWRPLDQPVAKAVRDLEGSHLLNILNYVAEKQTGVPANTPGQFLLLMPLIAPPHQPRSVLTGRELRFRTIREIVRECRWRGYLEVGRTFRLGALERRPKVWDGRTIAWVWAWQDMRKRLSLETLTAAAAAWEVPATWCPTRNVGSLPAHNRRFTAAGSAPITYPPIPIEVAAVPLSTLPPPRCRHCDKPLTTTKTMINGVCTRLACRAADKGLLAPRAPEPDLPIATSPPTGKRRIIVED